MTVYIDAKSDNNLCDAKVAIQIEEKTYPIYSYGTEEFRPNQDFHPSYPGGEYLEKMTDNSVLMWMEGHEYDLQYETTQCHSVAALKLGYLDDNKVFHEFSDYAIYKESSLTTKIDFSFCASMALSSETYTDTKFAWSGSSYKTATVYIVVKDTGYAGTYLGKCVKVNYL